MSKFDNAFMWSFLAASVVGLVMSAIVFLAMIDAIGV
jgi:hypothetical protein